MVFLFWWQYSYRLLVGNFLYAVIALCLHMNAALEIDFLQPAKAQDKKRFRWNSLAKVPLLRKFLKPIPTRSAMFAVDGGFEFELAPTITYQSGIAGGLIGTLIFGLMGSAVAIGSIAPFDISAESSSEANQLGLLVTQSTLSSTDATSNEMGIEVAEEIPAPSVAPKPAKSMAVDTDMNEHTPQEPKMNKEVLGFLPHWSLGDIDTIDFSKLTTLAYFDIKLKANGAADTSDESWQRLNSPAAQKMFAKAKSSDTKVVLTYTMFENDQIEAMVTNPAHRERAISHMVKAVKKYDTAGVNIDIEYQGNADSHVRKAYTAFVQEASKRMHKDVPGSNVTVSMYAGSAKYPMLYEVEKLGQVTDGIFMMAYDFATAGSTNAGPNAPLTGAPDTYWYDIASALKDFEAQGVAVEKIILGVPYYGYDWPTVGQHPKSPVVPGYAGAVTYAGTQRILKENGGQRKWDYEAQSPYIAYEQGGQQRVVYYDDEQSLGLKYDMVNEHNLQGVGIWALGQDGGAKELWQLLERKFGVHE